MTDARVYIEVSELQKVKGENEENVQDGDEDYFSVSENEADQTTHEILNDCSANNQNSSNESIGSHREDLFFSKKQQFHDIKAVVEPLAYPDDSNTTSCETLISSKPPIKNAFNDDLKLLTSSLPEIVIHPDTFSPEGNARACSYHDCRKINNGTAENSLQNGTANSFSFKEPLEISGDEKKQLNYTMSISADSEVLKEEESNCNQLEPVNETSAIQEKPVLENDPAKSAFSEFEHLSAKHTYVDAISGHIVFSKTDLEMLEEISKSNLVLKEELEESCKEKSKYKKRRSPQRVNLNKEATKNFPERIKTSLKSNQGHATKKGSASAAKDSHSKDILELSLSDHEDSKSVVSSESLEKNDDFATRQLHSQPCLLSAWKSINATETERPVANVDPSLLENLQKQRIWIINQGVSTPLSWYDDTTAADRKLAIVAACDAIVDSGFCLREALIYDKCDQKIEDTNAFEIHIDGELHMCGRGREYQYENFDKLENGKCYFLEERNDREYLEKVLGDRNRRFKVFVDPLSHSETKKALLRMRKGANLIKQTSFGYPHIRQFQLSRDNKRLVWYSASKDKNYSVVLIKDVKEIRLGQDTETFRRNKLPLLQHLSFSLVYGEDEKTLDLTCNDEFEYDDWLIGLKALMFSNEEKLISKEQLLRHSYRFRRALEKPKPSLRFSELTKSQRRTHASLEDCTDFPFLSPMELEKMLMNLQTRLYTMTGVIHKFDKNLEEDDINYGLSTSSMCDYLLLETDLAALDDSEMEAARMRELTEVVAQSLQEARKALMDIDTQMEKNGFQETVSAPSIVSVSPNGAIKIKKDFNGKSMEKEDTAHSSSGDKPSGFADITNNFVERINKCIGISSSISPSEQNERYQARRNKPHHFTTSERRSLQHIYKLLWKAEVDLENIADMYTRLTRSPSHHWPNFNKSISAASGYLAKVTSNVASAMNSIFLPFTDLY